MDSTTFLRQASNFALGCGFKFEFIKASAGTRQRERAVWRWREHRTSKREKERNGPFSPIRLHCSSYTSTSQILTPYDEHVTSVVARSKELTAKRIKQLRALVFISALHQC